MSYPFISNSELLAFCEQHKIIDSTFKAALVDLNYITVTSGAKFKIPNKSGMVRCEFLEFLVRVA